LNPGLNPSSVVCISAVKKDWSLIFFQAVQLVFVYTQNINFTFLANKTAEHQTTKVLKTEI
jgi:hypothetical protein